MHKIIKFLLKHFPSNKISMFLLKIGGSIITDKSKYKKPNTQLISNIAEVLGRNWGLIKGKLILIHGAGSFGHLPVKKYNIENGIKNEVDKLGFADTHQSCAELSGILTSKLIERGIPTISIPPAALIKTNKGRITKFDKDIIFEYLEKEYLPILYGDMVLDDDKGGIACSGDQIISYLGKWADEILIATNVNGVLDNEGETIPKIDKANLVLSGLCQKGSKSGLSLSKKQGNSHLRFWHRNEYCCQ